MSNISRKQKTHWLAWTIPIVVVLLVIAGVFWYHQSHKTTKTSATSKHHSGINYGPATDDEKQISENKKKEAGQNQTSSGSISNNSGSSQTKGTQNVTVVLTNVREAGDSVDANGFVAGVVETDGTCTLTLTKGSSVVTQSRQAHPNAENTTCGVTSIPMNKLSAGTWQAQLSYSSSTSTGKSNTMEITVN